jgi:hypothetical protein
MRRRLADGMPNGYRVVDLHDVWVGAPALAPQLVAADYRVTLLNVQPAELDAAVQTLLAAEKLPRERRREKKTVAYDLRPLLLDLQVRAADQAAKSMDNAETPPMGLWMRLRHSQDGGSGRMEEVVRALAETMGRTALAASSDEPVASSGAISADAATPDPVTPAIESVLAVRERLWLTEEL